MAYSSTVTLAAAADLIRDASHVAVTAHAKPDADAFGAVLALTTAVRVSGKTADAWLMPPVPANLAALRGGEVVRLYEAPMTLGEPDLVVVLDTGAWSQLAPMRADLERLLERTLIIDHHLSGDVPAANRYVDAKAAACCQIVGQLLDMLDTGTDPFDDAIVRDALFVGLASDTGWFRFSNTGPQTHEMAARLLRRGVDHAGLYGQLQQADRPQKLALLIRALKSLRLAAQDRVAVMVLSASDFKQSGALIEETEHIVDLPQMVASVQVVALVTEPPPATGGTRDDSIRMSFRSKPGPAAVDVARVAEQFGGGGHARAAGGKVKAPLEEVAQRVAAALEQAVGTGGGVR